MESTETFSESEFFEEEGRRIGEYSPGMLRTMKKKFSKQIANLFHANIDPKYAGHSVLDLRRQARVLTKEGVSARSAITKKITYHHDTIDFKDANGVEQVKFARRNSKPTDRIANKLGNELLVKDGHHFFSRQGINQFLELADSVELGSSRYRPVLLGVDELRQTALHAMPGEWPREHLYRFAELMRMHRLGFWDAAKDERYYSPETDTSREGEEQDLTDSLPKPPERNQHDIEEMLEVEPTYNKDKQEKDRYEASKAAAEKVKKTIPHCRYPLRNDLPAAEAKKYAGKYPYLVAGKNKENISEIFWVNKDREIYVPLRCKLVRETE